MMKPLLLVALLSAPARAQHPLEPLTAPEIEAAVDIARKAKSLPDAAFFPQVALDEPSKEYLRVWKPGRPAARRAALVVYDRAANKMSEAVVDLTARQLVSWTPRPSAQPNVMLEEFEMFPAVVKADERWRAAIKKRGLDPDKLWVDLWAAGPMTASEKSTGHRLLRALSYVSEGNKNPYAHPVEGVIALLDANTRKIVELVDTGVVPVSAAPGDFDDASNPPSRPGLKPLVITQPEGPSFQLDGHEVRWQNWVFRYALHPREGPVLYQVSYQDGPKLRMVLHRASLSEMLVPYGDPDSNWSFRNAFDEGEYGIGRMAGPIEPLRDAPANAVFVDAHFA
ncbi:MAG: tyramine oxidase, partial [Elusimicrobiota bacterium]|nr:tyramine oxidase [Elusimicrobiota bacterium]